MNFKTDVSYRKKTLIKLLDTITRYEDAVVRAMYEDFKKSSFESVLTETAIVASDLRSTIRNINRFTKRRRVFPALLNFPSQDFIYSEPYGDVLIIAPWNYPYQLALCPMIAAIAAGNRVTLKPSELTPNTSAVLSKIVAETFDSVHVKVIEGDAEVAKKLLAQRWDYIFFTGSVAVGKIVAKAAAEFLTPVTLELGGKNPCIVDHTADIKLSAKRIVWGKYVNAGQTCIAPDYILVQNKVKQQLISALQSEIIAAYGDNPEASPDFPRIINTKNWQRLVDMLGDATVILGGTHNSETLYVAPTLVDEPPLQSAVMENEIFGPILPILSYENEDELHTIISQYEKPLALYIFSTDKAFQKRMLRDFSFGGGCINDTMIYFANKRLPFGGVGHSGIGAYHGKYGFDTFSHKKPISKKANWLDIRMRYAPYGNKLGILRKILKWF